MHTGSPQFIAYTTLLHCDKHMRDAIGRPSKLLVKFASYLVLQYRFFCR